MNSGAIIAALAFCLLMLGGWPLFLAGVLLGCLWFAWNVFRKAPASDDANGWCQDLQQEIEEQRSRHA